MFDHSEQQCDQVKALVVLDFAVFHYVGLLKSP